jgi:hypothetical protein
MWRAVLVLKDTPHRVALGLAIGVFVGWMPIIGIQMSIAAVAALALRGNVTAAVLAVWFSNPITLIPCYWLEWWVGWLAMSLFVDLPWLGLDWIRDMITGLGDKGFWEGTRFLLGRKFLWDFFVPANVGGAILGIVTGLASYPYVRRAVLRYQKHRQRQQLVWLKQSRPAGG